MRCVKMENIWNKLRPYALLLGTLGGVIFGFLAGLWLKNAQPSVEIIEMMGFPGELFIRALQLMILPSVIFSLIGGFASLNVQTCGKVALRTFTYFLITSFFNTILGVLVSILIHPGDPSLKIELVEGSMEFSARPNTLLDSVMDLCRNIIPNNVITTLFELTQTVYTVDTADPSGMGYVKTTVFRNNTNFLGVISLALVIGAALSTLGNEAKPLLSLVKLCDNVFSKILGVILWLMPIGVFSMICSKILEVDNQSSLIAQLGLLVVTVTAGICIYQLIFMQLFYFLITWKNPFAFYIGVLPAALSGFALQSSSAALPVTLQCMDENKVDQRISRFVIPLGTTINMNGTALFVTVASIFIAQMNGVSLGFGQYATVCITATAVSIATATTPNASLSLMFIILNAIGLPVTDIGLLFSVDWFLDRIRIMNKCLR